MLTGWLPEKYCNALQKELEDRFIASVEYFDADEEENIPIQFENNAFVSPVEPVTSLYSLPSRGDIDPNSVMAIFYYLFFGMMLSDAAYGLIITFACAFVLWRLKPEGTMKQSVTMFLYCGISTVFWGTLFGSWFGNIVNVVSQNFFGKEMAIKPLWFDPVSDPVKLLIFAFSLGIIHIFTGMAVKFYMLCKKGKFFSAIFDVGFWYLVLGGAVVLAINTQVNMAILMEIGKYMIIIGAVGLVLTQGRSEKNIIMKFLKGLLSLYDITSYLSDVLSYSRLLALGLATGVIATVVNTMGGLGGGSILGAILLILVFLAGHTVNILINILGAYVHTNRLQYVEFFSKFYQGGGRPFKPFCIDTKFYKFKEEVKHD